ncbi:stromelysin-3 [Osmerus eperlanus]|uniref:stromelysin-3 n=1 Tax=Osmerus eperlanus TaxID=29151 RepID=UPI002E126EFE
MMLGPRLVCSILALHFLHCAYSVPLPAGKTTNRYREASWHLKTSHSSLRRGRMPPPQDTLQEVHSSLEKALPVNGTGVWKRRRCGVPDPPAPSHPETRSGGQQRRKRFVLFGGRWEKTHLTYKVVRFPWQMTQEKVRRVLQEALRVWSDVTPLTFAEVDSEQADIIIDFNRYWHGDNLPFDGPGGILAHAYFPRTHRQGDIHFDYDESWTVGNSMGTDLLQVAAHEFGHVLGLQHSLEPGAVMSPFYSFSYPLELSYDDKQGIQSLYGPPRQAPPPIIETNEIDTGEPDPCRTDFDAVSMIRGELFFFRAGYVWRLRGRALQAGYPAQASRHWRGLPQRLDAAYEDNAGNIWFFQGDSYWVFDAERRITGPDSVRSLGLPVSDLQAALKWGEGGAQKVFLFRAGAYWLFSPLENRVESSHPSSMEDWSGAPAHIDAAFQDRQGYVHFLHGLQYWKFDPVERKVLEGYPRYVGIDFFGCPASTYH